MGEPVLNEGYIQTKWQQISIQTAHFIQKQNLWSCDTGGRTESDTNTHVRTMNQKRRLRHMLCVALCVLTYVCDYSRFKRRLLALFLTEKLASVVVELSSSGGTVGRCLG